MSLFKSLPATFQPNCNHQEMDEPHRQDGWLQCIRENDVYSPSILRKPHSSLILNGGEVFLEWTDYRHYKTQISRSVRSDNRRIAACRHTHPIIGQSKSWSLTSCLQAWGLMTHSGQLYQQEVIKCLQVMASLSRKLTKIDFSTKKGVLSFKNYSKILIQNEL